jgi:hypothetical protein
VLYDLSSSYFEGTQCPLAARGYNRDQKKGKLQVNYGLLTDERGCPVSITAFSGNTSDPETLLPQVERLRGSFHLQSVVLVGDRGMISQKQIDSRQGQAGVDWITALKSGGVSGGVKMRQKRRFKNVGKKMRCHPQSRDDTQVYSGLDLIFHTIAFPFDKDRFCMMQ